VELTSQTKPLLATVDKKLSISGGGDRKKLRRLSRMGYHEMTKGRCDQFQSPFFARVPNSSLQIRKPINLARRMCQVDKAAIPVATLCDEVRLTVLVGSVLAI